ncbi:MAG TPA: hypothetical protein VFE62_07495 [Gemmataceae bacterium]|nr:hypothetical protein [Gemmataceae bacterium]
MDREVEQERKPRAFAEIGGTLIGGCLAIAGVIAAAGVVALAFRFLLWTIT